MVSEKKVKLMTRLASYEANEGKKNLAVVRFFRGDYLALRVINSVLSATLAYIIVIALYVLYNFEVFMQDIYKMDLPSLGMNVLKYYVVTVLFYTVVSYLIYSARYRKAKKSLRVYYNNLKKLLSLSEKENEK